jgi:hypothetical protein
MSTALEIEDRIEHAVEQPEQLRAIRSELAGSPGDLNPSERDALDAKIGEYLADHDRAAGDDFDPEVDAAGLGDDAAS